MLQVFAHWHGASRDWNIHCLRCVHREPGCYARQVLSQSYPQTQRQQRCVTKELQRAGASPAHPRVLQSLVRVRVAHQQAPQPQLSQCCLLRCQISGHSAAARGIVEHALALQGGCSCAARQSGCLAAVMRCAPLAPQALGTWSTQDPKAACSPRRLKQEENLSLRHAQSCLPQKQSQALGSSMDMFEDWLHAGLFSTVPVPPLLSETVDYLLVCYLKHRYPGIMVEGTVDRKEVRHSGTCATIKLHMHNLAFATTSCSQLCLCQQLDRYLVCMYGLSTQCCPLIYMFLVVITHCP